VAPCAIANGMDAHPSITPKTAARQRRSSGFSPDMGEVSPMAPPAPSRRRHGGSGRLVSSCRSALALLSPFENIMQIANNSGVSFHYTLTDDNGQVLDSSQGREPLVYLQGVGQIVPGLEKAMEGRQVGDQFKVDVAPEEGYGVHHAELVQEVPREAFQGV